MASQSLQLAMMEIPMQHASMYFITMYLVADVQCDAKTRMSAVEVTHLTPQNNAG